MAICPSCHGMHGPACCTNPPAGARVQSSTGGRSYGQIAYEAYCDTTAWKSLISGAQLPPWSELKPEIQRAWEAAAACVRNHPTSG